MMLKNKGLSLLVCFVFAFMSGLQSQDYVTDLRKANQLLSVAQERNRVASEELQDVKSRRQRLEEDLAYILDNPKSMSKEEKKNLEKNIKSLLKTEEDLLQRRKYANNLLLDVTDILQAHSKKRAKFISEYEKRFGEIKFSEVTVSQTITSSTKQPLNKNSQILPNSIDKETTNKTTIAGLENQSNNPPQPFLGMDAIAEKPAQPVDETTKKNPKKVQESKKKAVAQTDDNSKKNDSKTSSNKKNTQKAEPKEQIKNDAVVAKPLSADKQQNSKKDKASLVTMTRPESSKTSIVYKKYDPKEDVMVTSPTSLDCNLAFDGVDNFTGKKKQETTPILLFAHTDDFMRAAMKDKDFVTCDATATRVEGSRIVYLNLTFTIQTKEAQRTFGFLDRGSLIIFRLINGKKITLATNKTDIGAVDVNKGTTTFHAQLAIPDIDEVKQSELDVIRVSWSVGYEDYEIFDMDVLRNLFKCLDKK